MASTSIATYSLQLRKRYSPDVVRLGTLDGGMSVWQVANEFFCDQKQHYDHTDGEHMLYRVSHLVAEGAALAGLVEIGEYGLEAYGINVKTLRESFRRSTDDAEMFPFYFRWFLPHKSDTGILVLQRHGAIGVFGVLLEAFKKFCAARVPNYSLDVRRLVPADVLKELIDGQLREVELTVFAPPKDVFDKLVDLGNQKHMGAVTIRYKAKKGKFLTAPPWLQRMRSGRARVLQMGVEEFTKSGKRIRIGVEYRGKQRMVDLDSPESVAPYYDITNNIEFDPSGHPNFESIDEIAREITEELFTQLGKG